ncbi:aconitase X swivel domain-containing protein [Desulforhopalus singaporensis]|uniref:Predicted aconitase subunit 2 n=1 Tax=Desulforhopalus singaporensis TaxID=91360 RepID=A0A1H0KE10_9BACT|nr:DUF126 domain-containing protein [Desulforhopalus singaporensis]SDO54033.1 predicted aconitase subunit 2 [Desulforhopalus singaporensis]
MENVIHCKPLVAGRVSGQILKSNQTISFWGGVDPATGVVTDPRHELFGQSITGKVLLFPYGKGSAAAPMVLLELVRQKTGPVAIINVELDPLLVAGPVISKHFYDSQVVVALIGRGDFDKLQTGCDCVVDTDRQELSYRPVA